MGKIIFDVSDEIEKKFNAMQDTKKDAIMNLIIAFLEKTNDNTDES